MLHFRPRLPHRPGNAALRRLVAAIVVVLLVPRLAYADELHLEAGVLDGRLLDLGNNIYRIETPSGVLAVPQQAVKRRVPGPSRLERYAEEVNRTALSAERHLQLYDWCRDNRLPELANRHLESALALDPLSERARRLAGFVRVGDVWLLAGREPLPPARRTAEADALVENLLSGWQHRVRSIYDNHLTADADDATFDDGFEQLLSLDAPLAIPALVRILGDSDTRCRILLINVLEHYQEDEAVLNTLALALVDPDVDVRAAAALSLRDREDRRAVDWLRRALRCQVDTYVRRAAVALGIIQDSAAVGDLISALRADGFAGQLINPRRLAEEAVSVFSRPTPVPMDETAFFREPRCYVASFNRLRAEGVRMAEESPGPYRSEVQDALILITGENLGFNQEAWRAWVTAQPSQVPSGP